MFISYWTGIVGSSGGSLVKNPPVNSGDPRHMSLIPELGRSPGEGNGNPLQYSCLENAMDREARWATVHGVTKSQTWLRTHTHTQDMFSYSRNCPGVFLVVEPIWMLIKPSGWTSFRCMRVPLLHILTSTSWWLLLSFNHSDGGVLVIHCDFNLHLPDD